jgi:hypothetical protein
MAELNGVAHRLSVRGRCRPTDLTAALEGHSKPVVICDVEGDEEALLDPERVGGLRNATLLVETHEFLRRGITDELCRRFAPSHDFERIWQEPRSRAEFPWRTPSAPRLCPAPISTGRSANGALSACPGSG